jgi:hypothetical protein
VDRAAVLKLGKEDISRLEGCQASELYSHGELLLYEQCWCFALHLSPPAHGIVMGLNTRSVTGITLDAAGLVALADLATIKQRTALTGSASLFDILLLAPGIHTQQEASTVNGGDLPITAAMTTGYVFRIENQATVSYLQGVGEPGHLVTVNVEKESSPNLVASVFRTLRCTHALLSSLFYNTCIVLTITALAVLWSIHDFWAVGVLLMLILARLVNTVVIKRRAQKGWKGKLEPGVKGDLLVLLSEDRWIRMRGLVDDLKAVTSGQIYISPDLRLPI